VNYISLAENSFDLISSNKVNTLSYGFTKIKESTG
jgi:hypothetical protein